jgi:CheY-like chemotaxis protein/nitrogen-specific signal transduction histidine kinase
MARRTPEGGIVETLWDLTDDVHREQELRNARAAADAANRAKSEFLSSMSHELRTPLNAVLGFAQLLQRDKKDVLSSRHQDRVTQILKGGEHLLRLISDILDLSRIEAGGVSMSLESVAIAEVLEEVRVTLGPAAARARVSLELTSSVDAPAVRVDRTRFAQILLNFGSNAIKYNRPNGSVSFRVSAPGPSCVRVTVVDTGLGIPIAQQAKLFQAFHRAGQETGPIEGTGIGLAISKHLAELMEGRVGFCSVAAQGSEFWVEVPVDISTRSSMPALSVPTPEPRAMDMCGRVLYVEDNPANIRFMRDLLDLFDGVDLVTARTAESGVELAHANPPRVIILDINLPGMSGVDALRALRARPETEQIPVIALTAAASEHERRRGEQLGFHRYLTKPVNVAELEAALQPLLGSRCL